MPKTKISEYSSTAASNTDIGGIDLGEGTMLVSDVNNALREQMAQLKNFQTGASGDSVTIGGNLVVSGSATITSGSITGITDLSVADGGTGRSTLTANNVLLGNGTDPITFVAPGTSGNLLTSNGTSWVSQAGVSLASPLAVTGNSTAGAEIRLPEDTDNGTNYVALKAADTLASNVTFTLPDADGTSGQYLQTNGSGVLSFATVAAGTPTTQTYDTGTAATWTKPSSANWVLIELWGGGASGSRASGAAGGGGGAYHQFLVKFADLQGTVTYTVGGGGAGRTTNGNGNPGGQTSVSMATFAGGGTFTISAYGGGGGGQGGTLGAAGGGGGGGVTSVGSVGSGASGGAGGNPGGGTNLGADAGQNSPSGAGGGCGGNDGITGGGAFWGGAGGGGRNAAGGATVYGGGGGGGTTAGAGGASIYGGSGGAGGGAGGGTSGTAPAGGGGGSTGGTSGAGAAGRVRFTYW